MKTKIPQAPPRRPAEGPLHHLLTAGRRGDPVVQLDGAGRRFLLSHPDAVKHVLQDNHANYRQMVPEKPLMGHSSLTMSDGDAWRQRRRLLQPLFAPRRLEPLTGHAVAVTESMLGRWQPKVAAGEPLDAAREMARLSLDVLIAGLFGLEATANRELAARVHDAFDYFNNRQLRGGRQLPRWLPTAENRKLEAALEVIEGFVRQKLAAGRSGDAPEDALLTGLLEATDGRSGATLSDQELVDELMMLLVMGHMTTAMGLTWTLELLARHPEVEARVGEEAKALDGTPSAGDLDRLPYLRQVVEESLRLYPPTWSFSRGARDADEIAGIPVPAGATILLSPYLIHRRADFWPAPDTFDPDRFLPERIAKRHRFAYFPFGGGPRICIASQLALMEMPLVIATIARKIRLERSASGQTAVRAIITIEPQGGLPLTLRERA